ncbi:MAG: hypothetical protein DRR00_24075 [Candidatus Parabeggiatoa sp. nov. 3]|nr:MAG: hypothetical protein DRR00_24075 [Gammaproteobacteria bacterium]RKZ61141.1 MAG: hypothetical protein DRQ99_20965 [Gammaproteobacteria bacterium]
MVGSKKTLPTLQGMVLSLNVTNKTIRDNYFRDYAFMMRQNLFCLNWSAKFILLELECKIYFAA